MSTREPPAAVLPGMMDGSWRARRTLRRRAEPDGNGACPMLHSMEEPWLFRGAKGTAMAPRNQ